MIERPILFSGPMVRAILEDKKTNTRRLVKFGFFLDKSSRHPRWVKTGRGQIVEHQGRVCWLEGDGCLSPATEMCPYGEVGDRLWVRETFAIESAGEEYSFGDSPEHKDGRPVKCVDEDSGYWEVPHYLATEPDCYLTHPNQEEGDDRTRWKPSIHMPRWASRILLEITDVRVEKLQGITEKEALAEGVLSWAETVKTNLSKRTFLGDPDEPTMARFFFSHLWDSINAARGFGWDKNPWVWVVSFKRVRP